MLLVEFSFEDFFFINEYNLHFGILNTTGFKGGGGLLTLSLFLFLFIKNCLNAKIRE